MADSKTKDGEKTAMDPANRTNASDSSKAPRGEVKVEDQIAPLVASPTGPVPISAVAGTKEQAEELREKRKEKIEEERNHPKASEYIDEETLEGLSHAERRAIAKQRGYKIETGRRLSAKQLAKLQDDDEFIEMPKRSSAKKGTKKD